MKRFIQIRSYPKTMIGSLWDEMYVEFRKVANLDIRSLARRRNLYRTSAQIVEVKL